MASLRTKPGVLFDIVTESGARILQAAARQASLSTFDWYITSGTDGIHSGPNDPHKWGRAYDFSVQHFPNDFAIDRAVTALAAELGNQFFVQHETPQTNPHATAPHIHAQVRKGLDQS